ncbi:transcriptional regulator, TetR family [Bifidobacterium bohemicum]|uniref:TetR family transcriptional regulator n=1 Tax=Bifidobacterium bohemicum DSM 22767 TaxID=1437606 RepID=A0A086ZHD3_9BIFI|nr:TetR/AcrR family transcriptional regulator [Bifidobacterium bohemicum]KFI45933.1 TetR family transcriptional regulator [Bifidobacterium bohemicum DSM 22767]SCC14747.1 transcriptional regulator, TetR family [Bifidobacterium bohemicum]
MPRIKEATLEEHRRNTMNALLDSAEAIMREQGADGLTPAAVSRGAGIARNSIYRYVHDMKDLRRGLMKRHLPEWIDTLNNALDGLDDPVEVIATWVRVNLEQSVIHGHEWLMRLPVDDAEEYAKRQRENDDSKDGRGNPVGSGAITGDDKDPHDTDGDPDFSIPYVDPYCGKSLKARQTRIRQSDKEDCAPGAVNGGDQRQEQDAPEHGAGTGEQPLQPGQPSLHEQVNAPIVQAWERLKPSAPEVGVALTKGLVSSGMRLLSETTQAEQSQQAIIADIDRATRALIGVLRE